MIDLDLLRSLTGLEDEDALMDAYRSDPDLRERHDEVLGLAVALDGEANRRQETLREALAIPAPNEDRIVARSLAASGMQQRSPFVPRFLWAAAAVLVAALGVRWLYESPTSDPSEPEGVEVLGSEPEGFGLFAEAGRLQQLSVVRWSAFEGRDVTYDLELWAADEAGEPTGLDPLVAVRDVTATEWNLGPAPELPDSILVEVHAKEGGGWVASSSALWLRPASD